MSDFERRDTETSYSGTAIAERRRYHPWWRQALRDVWDYSIISWADRVVKAYAYCEPRSMTLPERAELKRQAMDMALHMDGRVGDWGPEDCIKAARMSDEHLIEHAADRNRHDLEWRRQMLRDALAQLGNPNVPCLARQQLSNIGEAMLKPPHQEHEIGP